MFLFRHLPDYFYLKKDGIIGAKVIAGLPGSLGSA
jgi:hypothetical protein